MPTKKKRITISLSDEAYNRVKDLSDKSGYIENLILGKSKVSSRRGRIVKDYDPRVDELLRDAEETLKRERERTSKL